jgi:hypothetical protein
MAWNPVKSTNVSAIEDRDPQTGDFGVRFLGGGEYRHYGVPAETHEGFLASESKGQFYHKHLKGRFGVTKV